MSPALANFLFEAANFLILAGLLGWVFFKPVRRALDAERERHAAEDEEATRRVAEAEAAIEESKRARQAAEAKLEERRRAIVSRAEAQGAQLVEKARNEARSRRQALEQELASKRSAAIQALAPAVGELAAGAVRNLLDQLDGPSLDRALVRAACDELANLPEDARQSAQIETARALDSDSRRLLEGVVGPFGERVVGELGAGIRVTTSAGQVDATALSLARQAERAVVQASSTPVATAEAP